MNEQQILADNYFQKAKARLLWLNIFTAFPIFAFIRNPTSLEFIAVLLLFFPFMISIIFLKEVPLISIITTGFSGILSVFLTANLGLLVFTEIFRDKLSKANLYKQFPLILGLVFLIYFTYLLLSTYHFSQKWYKLKSSNRQLNNILDEDEVLKTYGN